MRGNVRRFINGPPPCLAAVRDSCLDQRIPEHRAELIKRGLLGDPTLIAEARKHSKRPWKSYDGWSQQ